MSFKFSLCLYALLILFSCSSKEGEPTKKHEAAKPKEDITKDNLTDTSSKKITALNEVMALGFEEKSKPEWRKFFSERLALLGKSLRESSGEEKTLSGELQHFKDLVFAGCGPDLDKCQNSDFFMKIPQSSAVLQEICLISFNSDQNVFEYYRCLQMARDLKTNLPDQRHDELYLKNIHTLLKNLEQMGPKGRELLLRHRRILKLVLDKLVAESSPLAKAFAGRFKFPLDSNDRKIYGAKIESLLSRSVESPISFQDKEFNGRYENFKQKNSELLASIRLDLPPVSSEISLLEALFEEKISAEAAVHHWSLKQINPESLTTLVKTYLQYRFLDRVLESHAIFAQRFEIALSSNSSRVLEDYLLPAKAEQQEWSKFKYGTRLMVGSAKSFLTKHREPGRVEELKKFIFLLDRSLSRVVSIPQTLTLGILMKKMHFNTVSFNTLSLTVSTYNADSFFASMISGNFSPLIHYGDETPESYKAHWVLEAIFWMTRLGLFELYKISKKDFVQIIFSHLLTPLKQQLTNYRTGLFKSIEKDLNLNNLFGLCQAIKSGGSYAFTVDAIDLKTSLSMGKYTHSLVSAARVPDASKPNGVSIYASDVLNQVENIRLKFIPALTDAKTLRDILSQQDSWSKSDFILVEEELVRLEKDLKLHIEEWLRLSKTFASCFRTLWDEEFRIQERFIHAEKTFLSSIYNSMKELRQIRSQHGKESEVYTKKLNELNSAYGFQEIQQGERGATQLRFDGDVFRIYNFDIWQRIQRYYSGEVKFPGATVSQISKSVKVNYNPKSVMFDNSIKKENSLKLFFGFNLLFEEDESQFVSKGIRGYFNDITVSNNETELMFQWHHQSIETPDQLFLWPSLYISLARIGFIFEDANPKNFFLEEMLEHVEWSAEFYNFRKEHQDLDKILHRQVAPYAQGISTYVVGSRPMPLYSFPLKWTYSKQLGSDSPRPGRSADLLPANSSNLEKRMLSVYQELQLSRELILPGASKLLDSFRRSLGEEWEAQKRVTDYVRSAILQRVKNHQTQNKIFYSHLYKDEIKAYDFIDSWTLNDSQRYYEYIDALTQNFFRKEPPSK